MGKKYFFILLGFVLVLTSCSSFLDKTDPGFVERTQNREHLKLLRVGMTKKQVLAVMGEPLVNTNYNSPNVWFYYTDWDWADFSRSKIECTPVVFKDGVVIGYGRSFYNKYEHKDWLFDTNKPLGAHAEENSN